MQKIPKTEFKGLVENWQSDMIAAISVSLVALPFALGIAYASNVPPMAGILSAIIGGVVTTFFRGSHLAINGPIPRFTIERRKLLDKDIDHEVYHNFSNNFSVKVADKHAMDDFMTEELRSFIEHSKDATKMGTAI